MQKKPYTRPVLRDWGDVAKLTAVGLTQRGSDCKGGSVTHSSACD